MKAETKQALIKEVERQGAECTKYHLCLSWIVTGQAIWMKNKKKVPDYKWCLLKPTSPCGGYIVTIWHCPDNKQQDTVQAYLLDDFIRQYSGSTHGIADRMQLAIIAEQAQIERYNKLEVEGANPQPL